MGRGNGGTKSGSWREKKTIFFDGRTFNTPEDVHSYFMDSHAPIMNDWYDGAFGIKFETPPEKLKKLFDKAFSPATKEMTLYKGMSEDFQNYIEQKVGSKKIIGKSFIDKFYSSATRNEVIAESYAARNEDGPEVRSIIHFNVKKGTPIANPATNGVARRLHYNEEEITIRRNVKYTLRRIRTVTTDYDYYGFIFKHFYIDVSAK